MTDKEQHDLFNEVFTRLRKTEETSSNLCIRLDTVITQMETNAEVTDKFIELLEKRRLSDEAREAKFWKAIAILGGALIALALGKDSAKILAEHFFGTSNAPTAHVQAVIPWHNDERHAYFYQPMKGKETEA